MRREREYPSLWIPGPNPAQRLESTHAGHGEIHHDDVRGELEVALARRLTGFRLGDDLDLRQRLQQEPKSGADHGVIVDQENADHVLPASGISALRHTPRDSRFGNLEHAAQIA